MTHQGQAHIRWLRNTAPYINAHRGKTFVLLIPGEALRHDNIANIAHDIALLNTLGVRLVLVHGSRPQINQRLQQAGLETQFHNGIRVTDAQAMAQVKDAVGSLRAQIEALFSMGLPNSPMQGARFSLVSGNFVIARPIGIVDGVDYLHTGQVRRIETHAIKRQLDDNAIVLLSSQGYSPTGEVFNLASEDVAVQCAASLGADKLILFGEQQGIVDEHGELVRQCVVGETHALPVADPAQQRLLDAARRVCLAGVERCQIISYQDDCVLLEELFTYDGCGTLVSRDNFEISRRATIEDVGGILELIEPLEQRGVLLKRSRELLENEIGHFRLLERDGRIIACAALYPFAEDGTGELACVVSHPDYRGGQRGKRLLDELEREAKRLGLSRVFVLTTQTADWFVEHGFVPAELDSLPEQKQRLYNLQRRSRVLVKVL
ncbi:MAG: amino-acid N-acetyltransferase [Gammaproteobacteria bacterium]|nr:MAG: amino-acid N-acetyltransferase [Gammaproteobacteria bacterium]